MIKYDQSPLMVTIRCLCYNHEPYIRQCLEGFVMQKTNFRFEAIVHDDASTDGTAAIVREYAEKYPDIIKPILETENQYSKHDGSLRKVLDGKMHGKYIALCEGDDYWIDPLKLQKQVDFLESHPECVMICTRALLYSQIKRKIRGEQFCLNRNGFLNPKDVIKRGGLYIPTCSILHRKSLKENYPSYCKNSAVGDYPLQIFCALKGKVYYLDEPMVVYRIDNPQSWMGRQDWCSISPQRIQIVKSEISMFEGFMRDNPKYSRIFHDKIAEFINSNIPNWRHSMGDVRAFLDDFRDEIKDYTVFWKLDLIIMKCRIPYIRGIYSLLFRRNYDAKKTFKYSNLS